MRSALAFVALLAPPALASGFSLFRRHGDEDHGDGHDSQGVGHGHDMSHGAFNFTPSGIEWPMCLRHCCNDFFEYFPEPVNNPLCVSNAFYENVTSCVVQNCTEFEQGAYTVVVPIECPDADNMTAEAVQSALESDGGSPQSCEGVDNSTIQCSNETSTDNDGESGGVLTWSHAKETWIFSAAVIALPVLAML